MACPREHAFQERGKNMAEFVTCPAIGNAGYLRWVQFCERSCPFCKDTDVCHHKTTDISFPLNSKEVDASRVDEVVEAWEYYDSF